MKYSAEEYGVIQSTLQKKLSPLFISTRLGGNGKNLAYIESWKIINLANTIFGFNGWSHSVTSETIDFVDFINGYYSVGTSAHVKVQLRDGTSHEDLGYGVSEGISSKGLSIQKAKKDAVTDGLKRALRSFGDALGNCLSDPNYLKFVSKSAPISVLPQNINSDDLIKEFPIHELHQIRKSKRRMNSEACNSPGRHSSDLDCPSSSPILLKERNHSLKQVLPQGPHYMTPDHNEEIVTNPLPISDPGPCLDPDPLQNLSSISGQEIADDNKPLESSSEILPIENSFLSEEEVSSCTLLSIPDFLGNSDTEGRFSPDFLGFEEFSMPLSNLNEDGGDCKRKLLEVRKNTKEEPVTLDPLEIENPTSNPQNSCDRLCEDFKPQKIEHDQLNTLIPEVLLEESKDWQKSKPFPVKIYKCKVCDKGFKRYANLHYHKRIHTGERPYKCKICNKQYRGQSHLVTHLRLHTGERPYSCKYCSKRFKSSSDLNVHSRIHTGVKPFLCKICNRTFAHSTSLKIHLFGHSNVRSFGCKLCDKKFKYPSDLRQHKLIHTGEKPYICKHCKKAFNRASNLRTHQRTHTGEKPFKCFNCDRGFSQLHNLKRHSLKVHS